MSTPTQAESNAATLAAMTALTAAANAQFIADATSIIENMTSQGKYQVFLAHTRYTSFKDITTYFQGLGYNVVSPLCPFWQFGYAFGQFWTPWTPWFTQNQICCCHGTAQGPCKIMISWKNPFV